MYIHFLGTGTGGSTGSRRWRPANLVDTGDYLVVVDCGVGCHYRLSDRGLLTEVDYGAVWVWVVVCVGVGVVCCHVYMIAPAARATTPPAARYSICLLVIF
jgi:hypothetical protein